MLNGFTLIQGGEEIPTQFPSLHRNQKKIKKNKELKG
jgi:hypothetical protein